jgi:DUF1680 family protein
MRQEWEDASRATERERGKSMRKYSPVNFANVSVEGDFWRERLETVLTKTVPSQYEQLKQNGILESLSLPQPPPPLRIPRNHHNFTTQIFWDSDIGKWIEAASYALSHRRDAAIEAKIDAIVEQLAKAQLPDGYLNLWYIGREIENRWTNLRDNHELYCAGHMLEGALAYFQATGRRRFLDIMERYVDHIADMFGPGDNQKHGYCGHQEIEIALLKLYAATKERKHLDLAAYFINERGRQPHYFDAEAAARGEDPKDFHQKTYEYNQSHKPVREQDKVVGHAVRAMYMYAAMADLAAELGDDSLKRACEVLWKDVTSKRMYVTAGLGPDAANEGFTTDYDLPNATAYAETCASVALIFWAHRMLNIDCDSVYADVMERALYNGALSGLSRDGTHYYYENPLESAGDHHRWTWHHCPCCPMNVARLIGSIGGYFYSVGGDVLAVHLYCSGATEVSIGGSQVRIRQATDYPWSGAVQIDIGLDRDAEFALRMRIPDRRSPLRLTVNGDDAEYELDRGYAVVRRQWRDGDSVTLELAMPVERLYAHPAVKMDLGRVCVKRGPLVYCMEAVDNAGVAPTQSRLPREAELSTRPNPELFGGIVELSAAGAAADAADWDGDLYRQAPPHWRPAPLTLVPYYLWDNREPGEMLVWLAED